MACVNIRDRPHAVLTSGDVTQVWDLTDKTLRAAFSHDAPVRSLACATFNRPLAITGSEDGFVQLWDLIGSKGSPILVRHSGAVLAIATGSVGGRPYTVSAGLDGTVFLSELYRPYDPTKAISLPTPATALSLTDGYLSLVMDRQLYVLELNTGALRRP